MRRTLAVVSTCLASFVAVAFGAAHEGRPFDVPRLTAITVDGKAEDWGERGFRVDVLFDPALRRRPSADFDAALRLGWDERGLLVLATVTDATPCEDEKDDALWRADSIELFLAPALGANDLWQAIIAPGVDPRHPAVRVQISDFRKSEILKTTRPSAAVTRPKPTSSSGARTEISDFRKSEILKAAKLSPPAAARTKTASGYVLEALLPWENLGIKPEPGREVAFQAMVNDADGSRERSQLLWFPTGGAQWDTKRMQRLRLAERPGPPVIASASGGYERFRRTRVSVAATADLVGRNARVWDSRHCLGEAELVREGLFAGKATASLALPMPPRGKPYGPLSVYIRGRQVATLDLPDADALRKEAFARAEMSVKPSVFSGERFPQVEFDQPSLVEDLIGPYALKPTFYDSDFNAVTAAKKPGRYGAIVEIKPEDGPAAKRFFTLFRTPENINWRRIELPMTIELPKPFGIDPVVVREQSLALAEFFKWELRTSFSRNTTGAVVLAGLFETKQGTAAVRRTGPASADDRWWHALKAKTGDLVPYRYLVHLPPGAETGNEKRWPTILFLHGAGERGDNLKAVEVHGPPKIVKTRPFTESFPFIVISPQCPNGTWWSAPMLDDLLKEVAAKYPVDPDRIYLTGLSLGGFGSWMLAAEYPGRFAAVVPICGAGDPLDVERIKDVPIWIVHGGKDSVVPVEESQRMAEALRKVHGRVRFTVYPDADHDSWTATYANEDLYAWLLRQRRGQPQQPQAAVQGTAPSE